MHFAWQLTSFQSHSAIAIVAVLGWIFVVIPLWRFCRARFPSSEKLNRVHESVLQRLSHLFLLGNPFTKWLAAALVLAVVFAFGLWIGWHKELETAAFTKLFHKAPRAAAVSPAPAEREPKEPTISLTVASPVRGEQNTVAAEATDDLEAKDQQFENQAGKAWLDIKSEEKLLRGDREQEHVPAGRPAMQIADVVDEEFPTPTVTGRALTVTIVPDKETRIPGESVLIRVMMYDQAAPPDRRIVLTDAKTSYEWLTPHRDWANGDTKKLRVYYLPDVNRTRERTYFGYLVSIYYRGQLQSTRWQPHEIAIMFPPQRVPSDASVPGYSTPAAQSTWKTNIVTSVFWVGEKQNHESVWDPNWQANYGGFDDPNRSKRRNYIPAAFVPKQNPFYCALPYNDVTHGQFKPEAPLVIPWFKQAYTGQGQSVCWHRWIAIRKGDRTCYAQWEDVGPFLDDHFQYVFGNERPKPNANHGSGLNVSPAIRDYLGLQLTDVTDWQFVNTQDVPPGPWRSYGDNNNFVLARRQMEQKLAQQGAAPAVAQPEPLAEPLALAVASPTPGPSTSLPVKAGTATNDTSEIPAGSVLGISEVLASETPDPDSEKNVTLRISVKKRPNAVIDHTKLKIQVFFYDTVGDNLIKLTDADVSYEWLTPNHDWADSDSETLAVTYIRPKSKAKSAESDLAAAAAAVNPPKKGKPVKASPPRAAGARKYLGYIVRVYYNDQLQDKRADPAKLLNLFPAPLALESRTEDKSASAGSLVEQARKAYQQRDFVAASKFIDDANAADPNQAATLDLRGEILLEQKQFDQAEVEFKKALKADSQFRQARFNLALVTLKKKDYATARSRFEALLSATPSGSEAAQLINFNIYMTWLLEGKDSRAKKLMEQFESTDYTPTLYYAQAAWEFAHNNPTKATDWITSAKKIYSPELNVVFADSFYDLGWMQSPKANPAEQQSISPYDTAADFVDYSRKLREQSMLKVEPLSDEEDDNTDEWTSFSPDNGFFAATRRIPDNALIHRAYLDGSRVVIFRSKERNAQTLREIVARHEFRGLLIGKIDWSPDSKFLLFTTINSAGHTPMHVKTFVFCAADKTFRDVEAASGSVISEEFRFEPPDVALLEVQKPGKSGEIIEKEIKLPLAKVMHRMALAK